MVFTTDPVSGKIIDRILSAETEQDASERKSAAPAVFAVYPQENISDWSTKAVAEKTETISVKPPKVAALRKATAEKKNPVESTPPALPTANAEPTASSAQTTGESSEHQERSLLARLDPTGLPSKLAPLGQKAWNGATSLTTAVSSFVNAYRFF